LPNVIIVGGSDRGDNDMGYCYGANSVHLFAPSGVVTTRNFYLEDDSYDPYNYTGSDYYTIYKGTSASTPYVAGVAALLKSVVPTATVQEIRDAIMGGVDYIPHLDGKTIANGRLNAYKALLLLCGEDLTPTDVIIDEPNIGVGWMNFTLNSIRLRSHSITQPTSVFVDVRAIQNSSTNADNIGVVAHSNTVMLDPGDNVLSLPSTNFTGFVIGYDDYDNEILIRAQRAEVLIYRDNTRRDLFTRHVINPLIFRER